MNTAHHSVGVHGAAKLMNLMMTAQSSDPTTHVDMQAISLQWLLIARSLARSSPAEASIRLGLDKSEVELLAAADMNRLHQLSNQGKAAFRPLFDRRQLAPLAVAA